VGKEDEIELTCSMHGIDETWILKYWWQNVNGRDHLGDLVVEVATTLIELKADMCFFFT
jgi:hypothetical protein